MQTTPASLYLEKTEQFKRSENAMGNIRPTYIKRVAIALVERYPEKFTNDFNHNKAMILQLTDLAVDEGGTIKITHKRLLNMIAGYVTRYRKKLGL